MSVRRLSRWPSVCRLASDCCSGFIPLSRRPSWIRLKQFVTSKRVRTMNKLSILLSALLCASAVHAADLPDVKVSSFPTKSYFQQMFSSVPTGMDLRPPAKLNDYVVAGKLELSMRSYLDLVMANNTDISIHRVTLESSRNALLL